jgi:hypothetical protein
VQIFKIDYKAVYRTNKKWGKIMQIFMQNRRNFSGIFLFFSLHGVVIAMKVTNSPVIYNNSPIRLEQTMTIFDPKKELERGNSWSKVVPGSITITPDGKGVVIGDCGRVRYCPFDRENDDDNPETIIEHRCVTHTPIIDMAQKKDGSLLIVSAGNYINLEQKRVSEYVLFCKGMSKIQKLDWSIQAIALDSCGKMLAISGRREVVVIDLETDKSSRETFKGIANHNENWIVDIAINPLGKAVVSVGSQSGIQWMSLLRNNDGNIDLANLKQVVSGDIIKKIYYPSAEDLLYVTHNGGAKTIKIEDLLGSTGDDINKTTEFSHPWGYDMVVADSSDHIATAHWTNYKDGVNGAHRKIKVYCGNKDSVAEQFVLEIPTLDERYDYITEFGQSASGVGHLLHIALRGKQIVALATDGKMRVWSLPVKHESYDNTREEFYRKLEELKAVVPVKEKKRGRSNSNIEKLDKKKLTCSADSVNVIKKRGSSVPKPKLTLSADSVNAIDNRKSYSPKQSSMVSTDLLDSGDAIDNNKPKKSSPRILQILRNSSAHSSREGSLSPSREKSEKNEVSFGEVKEIIITKNFEDTI